MEMKIFVGNLKMHFDTPESFAQYLDSCKKHLGKLTKTQQDHIILCPPMIYIREMRSFFDKNKMEVRVGSQDAHYELRGAHTGETSPKSLMKSGVSHVILGHSERRQAGEVNKIVAKKVGTALSAGLVPIVCVGYIGDHDSEEEAIEETISYVTNGLDAEQVGKIIFAYEPVWAIGSGKTPTSQEIHTMILWIRKNINKYASEQSDKTTVLYGGSVDEENVLELCVGGHTDGALVGGASKFPEKIGYMSNLLNGVVKK